MSKSVSDIDINSVILNYYRQMLKTLVPGAGIEPARSLTSAGF